MPEEIKKEVSKEEIKQPSPIELIKMENDMLEAEIKRQEELHLKHQEIMNRRILGGKSDAGQAPVKPKEYTPKEYANLVRKGEMNPLNPNG